MGLDSPWELRYERSFVTDEQGLGRWEYVIKILPTMRGFSLNDYPTVRVENMVKIE